MMTLLLPLIVATVMAVTPVPVPTGVSESAVHAGPP